MPNVVVDSTTQKKGCFASSSRKVALRELFKVVDIRDVKSLKNYHSKRFGRLIFFAVSREQELQKVKAKIAGYVYVPIVVNDQEKGIQASWVTSCIWSLHEVT